MSTLLLLALVSLSDAADRVCYEIEYVEIPEIDQGCFFGLNDHMQLTGNACTGPECWPIVGFVYDYRTGAYDPFSPDGYDIVMWSKVNNHGVVAFEASNLDGTMAGFLRWPDGTIEQLPYPGEGEPTPYSAIGINNAGSIVGYVWDAAEGRDRGVIWTDDGYTVADGPGPGSNYFADITDDGAVIGVSVWEDGVFGFRDDGRTVTWYDVGGLGMTEALGGNNRGQVTLLDISAESGGAFVSARGHVTELVDRDDAYVLSADINNRGVAALEVLDTIDRPAIAWPVACPGK